MLDSFIRTKATCTNIDCLLGVMQWSCLLQHVVYNCFDSVYRFVDHDQLDVAFDVPAAIASEILAAAFLQPSLVADFERQGSLRSPLAMHQQLTASECRVHTYLLCKLPNLDAAHIDAAITVGSSQPREIQRRSHASARLIGYR